MKKRVTIELADLLERPGQIPVTGELGYGKAYGHRALFGYVATQHLRRRIEQLQPPRCSICGINT